MADILVVLDGLSEQRQDFVPEVIMPALQTLKKDKILVCPQEKSIDSLHGMAALLGVRTEDVPKGRGALEWIAKGMDLQEGKCVFRCNIVKLEKGLLAEADQRLIGMDISLEQQFAQIFGGSFYRLEDSRYLWKTESTKMLCHCPAPHGFLGMELEFCLQEYKELKEFILASRKSFATWNDENIQFALWPWGEGNQQELQRLSVGEKISGTMITGTAVIGGLAMALGMDVLTDSFWTGDTDTDLHGKLKATLSGAAKGLVVLHINGGDEAAHRRQYHEKISFLQKVNQEVLIPLIASEHNVSVTTDHGTDSKTGQHFGQIQPIWHKGGATWPKVL